MSKCRIRTKNHKRETLKMKVKLPHKNKKPLERKQFFLTTPFSHYLKNKAEKFHAAKPQIILQFDFKNLENVFKELKHSRI